MIRAPPSELREVALLRDRPVAQGVALVEWLLTSPATPLYGAEVDPLRQELGRAGYLLARKPRDAESSYQQRPTVGSRS